MKALYTSADLAGVHPEQLYETNPWQICDPAQHGNARADHLVSAPIPEQLAHALKEARSIAEDVLFDFAVGPDYFAEIAKFRAIRLLWRRVGDRAARVLARTTVPEHTDDPYTNLLRGTTQAMSAIVGGCDFLIVHPFDEQAADFARRLAVDTQLILRHEAHFDSMPDPAAGCWYLETLTAQFVESAWKIYQG